MTSRTRWPFARRGRLTIVLLACCALLLLLDCLPVAQALRCLSCKGCSKFEDSQAVQCAPTHDRCLKLHMPSGLINRECGDEKMCQDKSNDRERHSAVHCCEANMCNGAPPAGTRSSSIIAVVFGRSTASIFATAAAAGCCALVVASSFRLFLF